jgi:hypothetical protein
MWGQRLARAEQDLNDVEEQILRQREIMAELQKGRLSTTVAKEIAHSLLQLRERHEDVLRGLRARLGKG